MLDDAANASLGENKGKKEERNGRWWSVVGWDPSCAAAAVAAVLSSYWSLAAGCPLERTPRTLLGWGQEVWGGVRVARDQRLLPGPPGHTLCLLHTYDGTPFL